MAAEEVLKYKVEIDQADLATQLSDIKNQIDQAVGSIAFNQQSPTQDPVVNMASQFTGGMQDAYGKITSDAGMFGDMLESTRETGRLGYQKFVEDAQVAGLISPPSYANQISSLQAVKPYIPEGVGDDGFISSSLGARFGLGHDPNMSISRGEYQRIEAKRAGERILDFGANTLAVASMFGGVPGTIAGGAVWLGKAAFEAANYEEDAVQSFAKYINTTSFRNLESLDKKDSVEAARYVRNLSEDVNIRSAVGDAADVENVISEAVSAGIFLDTSNVEQFKTKAKDTLEQFRQVQHALNTTTEEALAVMGEFMQSGITRSVTDTTNLVLNAQRIGQSSGYSDKEMLGIAQQGAEMVRGTGMDMGKAAETAMALTGMIRNNIDTVFDRDLVLQAGGSDRAAMALMRMASDFGNSSIGKMYEMAGANGYTAGGGLNSLVNAVTGSLGDGSPQDITDAVTQQRIRGRTTDLRTNLINKADNLFTYMDQYGVDITQDNLETWAIAGGDSALEASLFASTMAGYIEDPDQFMRAEVDLIGDKARARRDETPALLKKLGAELAIPFRKGWNSIIGEIGRDYNEFKVDLGESWATILGQRQTNEGRSIEDKATNFYQIEKNKETREEEEAILEAGGGEGVSEPEMARMRRDKEAYDELTATLKTKKSESSYKDMGLYMPHESISDAGWEVIGAGEASSAIERDWVGKEGSALRTLVEADNKTGAEALRKNLKFLRKKEILTDEEADNFSAENVMRIEKGEAIVLNKGGVDFEIELTPGMKEGLESVTGGGSMGYNEVMAKYKKFEITKKKLTGELEDSLSKMFERTISNPEQKGLEKYREMNKDRTDLSQDAMRDMAKGGADDLAKTLMEDPEAMDGIEKDALDSIAILEKEKKGGVTAERWKIIDEEIGVYNSVVTTVGKIKSTGELSKMKAAETVMQEGLTDDYVKKAEQYIKKNNLESLNTDDPATYASAMAGIGYMLSTDTEANASGVYNELLEASNLGEATKTASDSKWISDPAKAEAYQTALETRQAKDSATISNSNIESMGWIDASKLTADKTTNIDKNLTALVAKLGVATSTERTK